jgi:diaminopimelate decarboxylase
VKFGFSISSGDAKRAAAVVEANDHLELAGVHCHIGSQIFLSDGYFAAIERVLQFIAEHRDLHDHEVEVFNFGGGFGVAYLSEESSLVPDDIMKVISIKFLSLCAQYGLNTLKVSSEPGRAIVAPSTTTLYRVGTTKEVSLDSGKVRRYISVDGGMSDNIRPALYGAKYLAILANRNSSASTVNSRLVGKHCESGDIIIDEIQLPSDVIPGDLLAVPVTGAYGRSMASNYNHVTRPAVIAVQSGKSGVILRAENYQDLIALEGQGL